MANDELFPIVTPDGEVVGSATRGECHSGSFLLHPVVHLHLFDSERRLYLQQRSLNKDIQPGRWDTSVGGHIDYGESVEEALRREVREELGVVDFQPKFVARYLFQSPIERELVNVYRCVYDGEIVPDEGEIQQGRFWTIQEIRTAFGTGLFTPNFESEVERLSLLD